MTIAVAATPRRPARDPQQERPIVSSDSDYWRARFRSRRYVEAGAPFADYEPAYLFGADAWRDHGEAGRTFQEIEGDLALRWELCRGESRLDWCEARPAVLDAWARERDAVPSLLRAIAELSRDRSIVAGPAA